jgi:hypothetical protein
MQIPSFARIKHGAKYTGILHKTNGSDLGSIEVEPELDSITVLAE